MNMRLLGALLIVASCVVLGCKPEEDKAKEAVKPSGLTKLEIKDKKIGKGPAVENGDTVWVRYTGKFKNGVEFDSNEKEGKGPMNVLVGSGKVIKGWDMGLLGIKEGGQRHLGIPSSLGYGAQDSGKIPPNTDLYFDIRVVKVLKAADANQVGVKILTEGSGRGLKKGDMAVIEYVATDVEGKEILSSKKEGAPVTFKVGNNELNVNGLEAGLLTPPMKVGEKRRITFPPPLGLPVGFGGVGEPTIQTFVVTLKSIG
jgi:peptidylprolyl isomerase